MAEDEINEDDDIISEQAEYSPKSEFSKASHVSESVKLAMENRAKEMKPGYMNSVLDKNNNEVRTWISDTRKIYISSVEALRLLLAPEILRDKRMKGKEEKFKKDKKAILDKYSFEDFEVDGKEKVNSSGASYKIKKNGKKYMPEIDEEVKTSNMKGNNIVYQKGFWNKNVTSYWNEILELYDDYFGDINILIDSLNYFKASINF